MSNPSFALRRAALGLSSARALHRQPASLIMAPTKRKQSVPTGYKEDLSKGNMLRFEDSLPRLPVPTLEETAKRYLTSVHPLLSASEYQQTKKAVEDFVAPNGKGVELQKRLQARAADPNVHNWLYDWWNSTAYLGDTGPVVPYVSFFFGHKDDRQRRDPATRAAAITTAALEFKRQVDEGSIEPEYMRGQPMTMSCYWWMFNASRVPARPDCYPVKYSYKEHPYILVVRKNQFFKVYHELDGKKLNNSELEAQFRRVYELAEKAPAVGILTAERRGEWTKMRENLIAASPANKAALETIEASSFVVCLDDATPVTLEERAHQLWHGDGSNRWFDKPVQWIINDNGTSGCCGEHSMIDGSPTHRLSDTVCAWIAHNKVDLAPASVRSTLPDPQPINFVVDQAVQKDIADARAFHEGEIAKHELRVFTYQGYGKGMMKKFKCSPDAYVQMLLQLAYKKMYGKVRPVYESAATRKFQQGRTETCRSVSDESVAFCNAMEDPSVPRKECVKLFRAALKSQSSYVANAAEGHGVDRHLFGLKKCLKENEELPEIYKDPAFAYSSHWFMSTSQLSSEYYLNYGWSQVFDDGWGMAYMINENSIHINVVSKGLGNERMVHYLTDAANDLRDMMMPELEPEKAKL